MDREARDSISVQVATSESTSRRSSSAETPSAAVRTMSPWPVGRISSVILRSLRRSVSPRRFEIPNALEFGTRTTKRPGMETSWVSRAPLAPIGFFVTWQTIVWPALSICSIRSPEPERPDSTSSLSNWTSPRYSTPFFGIPMSMNAASMPGRTFWTLPT